MDDTVLSEAKLVDYISMKAQGYCHFNENGKNTSFRINLFEMDWDIEQDPGSRDLGHGAVVWDAAVVLAKYMEKNYKDYDRKSLAKRTVLELGSGCGLGGIAFMMKGADVSCTDLLRVTQRLTEKNVKMAYSRLKASLDPILSNQTIEPKIYPIDWTENPICSGKSQAKAGGDASKLEADRASGVAEAMTKLHIAAELPEDSEAPVNTTAPAAETTDEAQPATSDFDALVRGAPYDYVVLTDCVFSAELAVPLVNTILCGCGPRTTVLCCHEIRDEDANAAFIREFSKHFVLKRVAPSKLHDDYRNDLIELITAKPIRAKKADK